VIRTRDLLLVRQTSQKWSKYHPPKRINRLPPASARTEDPEVASKTSKTSLLWTSRGTFTAQ